MAVPTRIETTRIRQFLLVLMTFVVASTPAAIAAVTAFQITSTSDLLGGASATGVVTDYMMANDSIVVVISDIPHDGFHAVSGGNIIDAANQTTRFDGLGTHYLYFGDTWPRQANYHTITITNDGSGGGPAVIRSSGVDTDNSQLLVTTDAILADQETYITLETTITNIGASAITNHILGDAFHWADANLFVPGYGFSNPSDMEAPWLAATTGQISYGFVSPENDLWGENGDYWTDVNEVIATIPSGGSVTYSRGITIGDQDIASASDIIHDLLGMSTGLLRCELIRLPENQPFAGALVNVYDTEGNIYLQMEAMDDGWADATLSAGDWRLQAFASGYEADDVWISIATGETTTQLINLSGAGIPAVGDTLTVIQKPILNIPEIVAAGESFTIQCEAPASAADWTAQLIYEGRLIDLEISAATYDTSTDWWLLSVQAPVEPVVHELYDLRVTASVPGTDPLDDTTRNAVQLIPGFKDDYYFIHITDSHLPTHLYYYQDGSLADSTETLDLRAVIDDINIINPEFVLHTGDLVNEGELEDFQYRRYFTRAQRLLTELEVPFYLTGGNHDLGGWNDTPPSDGTARRTWWRFFGWRHLDDPPAGAPWYTQNYSFDYGPIHYVGLEAYNNYDNWRSGIYGSDSFTSGQLSWLSNDLADAAGSAAQVLFYHKDFQNQINLQSLGVEMALWGHIHSNDGNINQQPYDLSTDNTCDGDRSFRLIRVSGGELTPVHSIQSGSAGQNLTVSYSPDNQGNSLIVTAVVDNNFSHRFEHGLLRIRMPNESGQFEVVGGELQQVALQDTVAICYIGVDLMPNSEQEVIVSLAPSCSTEALHSEQLRLYQNHPNPFSFETDLRYYLPGPGKIILSVFDGTGRLVAALENGQRGGGEQRFVWDGNRSSGEPLPAGIFFAHLVFQPDSSQTNVNNDARQFEIRKMILVR
jgi:Calcineurin-like phosphoesterase